MIRDDEHWLTLSDSFHAAALDPAGWYGALAALADATGSQHGQLACIGKDATETLNLLTSVDPELPAAFVAAGGNDPSVNPRRRAGLSRSPMTVIAESDFITPDECSRDAHYQEFAVPWKVPYICLTVLERQPELLVGLAVIRTRRQGHIDPEGRRAFASIAPHVRAAVRTSLALADHGEALLSDALDGLSIPAFICDGAGIVRRLTPAAESLVSSASSGLKLKLGRLTALRPGEARALADAIGAVGSQRCAGASPSHGIVVHPHESNAAPLSIEVVPLPNQRLPFPYDARVLVLVRGGVSSDDACRRATLRSAYGMTAAEAEIALGLSAGRTTAVIARSRGVAIGTVRQQIKAVLAKTGTCRQVELVARLKAL